MQESRRRYTKREQTICIILNTIAALWGLIVWRMFLTFQTIFIYIDKTVFPSLVFVREYETLIVFTNPV